MSEEINTIAFERVGLLMHIIEKAGLMGSHGGNIVAEAMLEISKINAEAGEIQAQRRAAAQAEIDAANEAASREQVGEPDDEEEEDEVDEEEEDDE